MEEAGSPFDENRDPRAGPDSPPSGGSPPSSSPSTQDYLSRFDLSPLTFPFRGSIPSLIETRRALLSDLLIFDILLSSGGIRSPDALYPPTDVDGLARLLDAIAGCHYDTLKKDCLVYFLLQWHGFQDEEGVGGDTSRAKRFVGERCIPPQFVILADAYWNLDTGFDVKRAVATLTDARLNRDYASKILQAIVLAEDSAPLVVKYVRTARPLLTEPDDLDLYCTALLESSPSGFKDAWLFQRTFAETGETKARLLQRILTWCLMPKPRPGPLKSLLAAPFTPYEQEIIHTYAVSPPSELATSSVPIIQDLVCLRLVQHGKYAQAIELDRQFPSKTGTRRQMLAEITEMMPAVERRSLQARLEVSGTEKFKIAKMDPTASVRRSAAANAEDPLGMSWESIPKPKTNNSASMYSYGSTMQASIPERSGAPRFGSATASHAQPAPVPSAALRRPLASIEPASVASAGPRIPTSGATAQANAARLFAPPAPLAATATPGIRHPLAVDSAMPPPPPRPKHYPDLNVSFVDDGDSHMDTDAEVDAQLRANDTTLTDDEGQQSFNVSVFSHPERPEPSSDAPSPVFPGAAWRKRETDQMLPPGAFFSTPAPGPISGAASSSAQTVLADESPQDRPTRARKPTAKPDKSLPAPSSRKSRQSHLALSDPEPNVLSQSTRSMPGSLLAASDGEDEEQAAEAEEEPAPLPQRSTRSRRTRQSSSDADAESASVVGDDDGANRRQTRRSTRLRGSQSPEAESPQKSRRITRKNTSGSVGGSEGASASVAGKGKRRR